MKANFDSAFTGSSGCLRSRVVIQESQGRVLDACTHPYRHVPSLFTMEALAFLSAVTFARDHGFFRVLFKGDSLHVIRKLDSSQDDYFEIRALIIEGQARLLIDFREATVCHYFQEPISLLI